MRTLRPNFAMSVLGFVICYGRLFLDSPIIQGLTPAMLQ